MNLIKSFLNDITVAIIFVLATKIANESMLFGIIAFTLAYVCLDLHSYIDKKLGYPNNLFIN